MNWMNILGVFLAVLGAIGFSTGAQIQHHCVNSAAALCVEHPTHLQKILGWVKDPKWLAGFAIICFSVVLHLGAVAVAPVSLVQPLGVLSVPVNLFYTSLSTGVRPRMRVQFAVVLTLFSIGAFSLGAAWFANNPVVGSISKAAALIIQIVIWSLAVFFMFLGEYGPRSWAALFWGTAAGALYGLATGNMKHLIVLIFSSETDWSGVVLSTVVVGISYLTGIWCVQHGYALAPAEVLVACVTVLDPIVAVSFGFLVLGEAAYIPQSVLMMMFVSGALAVLGVVLTSWTSKIDVRGKNLVEFPKCSDTGVAGSTKSD